MLYGVESVITYAAYKHTDKQFEIICQVKEVLDAKGSPKLDEFGNFIYEEVPGSPNLPAQLQPAQKVNAAPVVDAGPSDREALLQKQLDELRAQLANKPEPVTERKKPGPKPKLQTEGATV